MRTTLWVKNILFVSVQSGERMSLPTPTSKTGASHAHLERRIGLRSAVLFNMLEMIGVGPFITLPLVIAAAGFRLSVWAWVLGAAIAVADGLVWAELGAAFPQAGGSYAFLREIYGPSRAGNWLSFLYVWQLSFSAPLSIASGCIGLSSFLAWFWPDLNGAPFAFLPALHYANFAAGGACLLVTALLYRRLSVVTGTAWVLFVGVIAAIAGVIVSGFAHASALGGWHMPPAPALALPQVLHGLAQGTLLATYCYWGYYNITFLGSEVRHPERTIPRAILLSVAFVSAFYVLMNMAALPSMADAAAHAAEQRDHARATGGEHRAFRVRLLGRIHHGGAGGVDGLLVGVLAAAGLLARALCRGAERQLLQFPRRHSSAPPHSPSFAGGARAGGVVLLLVHPGAGDHHAGHHPHPAAVFPAARGRDAAARAAARI